MRAVIEVPGPMLPWKRTNTYKGRRIEDTAQAAMQGRIQIAWVQSLSARTRKAWPTDAYYRTEILVAYPDRGVRDGDNIAKQVHDALEGLAWFNDCRVWDHRVRRFLGEAKTMILAEVLDEPKHRTMRFS